MHALGTFFVLINGYQTFDQSHIYNVLPWDDSEFSISLKGHNFSIYFYMNWTGYIMFVGSAFEVYFCCMWHIWLDIALVALFHSLKLRYSGNPHFLPFGHHTGARWGTTKRWLLMLKRWIKLFKCVPDIDPWLRELLKMSRGYYHPLIRRKISCRDWR